jgi:hypothetical protein
MIHGRQSIVNTDAPPRARIRAERGRPTSVSHLLLAYLDGREEAKRPQTNAFRRQILPFAVK